jgi:hypothetical protein
MAAVEKIQSLGTRELDEIIRGQRKNWRASFTKVFSVIK